MKHINLAVDQRIPDAQAQQVIAKRLRKSDQSPSSRSQSDYYRFFQEQISILGQPYDVTRIPISVLQQMHRDPMLAFGQHFINLPVQRAKWHIKCERADIAAFLDNTIRQIRARYIAQRSQAQAFGFAPIVKRFQQENPNWTYEKAGEQVPVWDNGSIEAITLKPFVVLPSDPSQAEPNWNRTGEFNGIKYQGGKNPLPFPTIDTVNDGEKEIDLQHSLWVTNEKDKSNGSLWGYPLFGYAYRYWWSYWFRWALYDRFFERKADPPYVVYYPSGQGADYTQEDEDSDPTSMKQIALGIGDSAKGGGTLAMPGETINGYDDRPTSIRQWQIEELEVKGDMSHFVDSFEYLDIMKLRSLWISELALIEGSGGTSSRNVAGEQISIHKEGSAELASEIDHEFNRYIIPDLLATNFPEFDGTALKVTTGFTDADQQTLDSILNLFGQNDADALRNIDIREVLDRMGVPIVSLKEIDRQNAEAEKALKESVPDVVIPNDGNAGVNQQGFYEGGGGAIHLATPNFTAKLPSTKHYDDNVVLSQAAALRERWRKEYIDVYEDFANFVSTLEFDDIVFIEKLDLDAKLVPNKPGVKNWVERKGGLPKAIADIAGDLISERGFSVSHAIATAVNQAKKLCAKGNAKYCKAVAQWEKMKMAQADLGINLAQDSLADKIIGAWRYSRDKVSTLLDDTNSINEKVINRAAQRELRRIRTDQDWVPSNESISAYLADRGAVYVKAIDETVREELRTYLANVVDSDMTHAEIVSGIREHFADFPSWKADRLARTEIRDAYNFATIEAGEQAGIKVVQIFDALKGEEVSDPECIERNGKFFKIGQALSEVLKEHPNGTAEIRLTNRENLSVQHVSEIPDDPNKLAYFDEEADIVYIRNDISVELEHEYLNELGKILENENIC